MGKAVLVVDDERPILALVGLALQDYGYSVFTAADGNLAFEALETVPLDVAGLITDIDLGNGPDGWAVARAARRLRPDIAVVYITGESRAGWRQHGVIGSVLIQKPFTPDQIALAIHALL